MLPAVPPRASAPVAVVVARPSVTSVIRPSILRSTWKVANEVIWPCSYALCTAPVRAAALLGTALGLRRNRRRPARRIGGSVSCQRKPQARAPSPLAHIAQELRHGAAELGDKLRHLFAGRMQAPSPTPGPAQSAQVPLTPEEVAAVHPGALYQNDYMTLWNDSNDPVSAVLRVVTPDRFELKVSQLDSLGGGSDGWVIFRSGFTVHDIPDQPHRKRLQLHNVRDVKVLDYDESKFERRANLMLGILKRCSWVLMGAFQLELDLKKNQVVCGPRAALLKPFWETTVALVKTTEASMWIFNPHPSRALVTA